MGSKNGTNKEEQQRKREALVRLRSDLERYLGNIVMRLGRVNQEIAEIDGKPKQPAHTDGEPGVIVLDVTEHAEK